MVQPKISKSSFAFSVCILIGGLSWGSNDAQGEQSPPNVVVIVADDLGYSDLGCYGGEIKTPRLDELAANGLRFTQFYNTARCWSSRASILTGYYAHQVRRDKVPGIVSGAQANRPKWAKLLPEMLKSTGYRSYQSGKWHVDGSPIVGGFDHAYRLDDGGRYFRPQAHFEDDQKLPNVKPGTDFYGTIAVAEHGITYLKEHANKYKNQPFFLYLAFHAPHFPLQALPEDIAKYQGRYDAGWEVVRAERAKRVRELGLVSSSLSEVEREIGPPYDLPESMKALGPDEVNRPLPWASLTPSQQAFQAKKMEIHAAMVDRMDREIGRVIDQLKAMNAFDNTLIMFVSDNGASAEIMVRDDGHDPQAAPGSAETHLCLGPGWSSVANTPFRRHKTWVHEGGISTPMVAHWPVGIKAKGELRTDPAHLMDIVPTILEATGTNPIRQVDGKPVPASPAKTLLPAMVGPGSVGHKELWFEHEGNRAVRVGDWKLVAARDKPWELFRLSDDRTETHNLVKEMPERARELSARWEALYDEFCTLAKQDAPPAPAGKAATKKAATKKAAAAEPAQAKAEPVKQLILPGESFLVMGRPSFVMLPEPSKRKSPQPWIFYAPTLAPYPDQAEKWMHQKFLDAGVAVAGIDIGEAYGSPKGREFFDSFYAELQSRGYAKKPCMLGRSRGGLWVTSWAAENPDKVAGIAGIYPVFDLRTYPGLKNAAPAYGLKPEELEAQLPKLNPIGKGEILAKAKVPVFLIHGDDDKVVPLKENSQELAEKYRQAGSPELLKLVIAEGQGHNMWEGFFRCQALVDFAIARAGDGANNK